MTWRWRGLGRGGRWGVIAGIALTVAIGVRGWFEWRIRQDERVMRWLRDSLTEAEAALRAVADAPNDADRLRQAAFALARHGLYLDALPFLRRAVDVRPDDAGLWFALGQLYEVLGRDEHTIETYRRASQLRPDDVEILLRLASAYLKRAWTREAEPLLEQARRQAPRDPRVFASLGMLKARVGDRFGARAQFRTAIGLQPENDRFYALLAEVEQRDALLDEALRWLEEAIRRRPQHIPYLQQKVTILLARPRARAEHLAQAERLCRQILAQDPHHLVALFYQARIQQQRGNLEAAFYQFRSLFAQRPTLSTLSLELGNLYTRRGDREEGDYLQHYYQIIDKLSRQRDYLEWQTQLNPDSVTAHWDYARFSYRRDDDATAAFECWRILRLQPDHLQARRLRDEALYRARRWEEIGGE